MKNQLKTIAMTSGFWILAVGVIVAFVMSAKSNFERGYQSGVTQTVKTLHATK